MKFLIYGMNYLQKTMILDQLLKLIKGIPIYRKNTQQAIDSINIAQSRLNEGYHIAIFPEGTRTITGKLSRLKKGGFHLAKNTKAKILPVIVKGLFEIKPKSRWSINTSVIATMIIEKPIETFDKSVEQLVNTMSTVFKKHGLN